MSQSGQDKGADLDEGKLILSISPHGPSSRDTGGDGGSRAAKLQFHSIHTPSSEVLLYFWFEHSIGDQLRL